MSRPASHLRVAARLAPAGPPAPGRLRVVEAEARRSARSGHRARIVAVAGIGMTAVVMFGLVYLHVVLAQRQILLDHLSTVATVRQSEYQSLRLRVSQLESPQQIVSAAEGRLGMIPPAVVTYVTTPAGYRTAAPRAAPGGGRATDSAVPAHPARGLPGPAGNADWPRVKAELAHRP